MIGFTSSTSNHELFDKILHSEVLYSEVLYDVVSRILLYYIAFYCESPFLYQYHVYQNYLFPYRCIWNISPLVHFFPYFYSLPGDT